MLWCVIAAKDNVNSTAVSTVGELLTRFACCDKRGKPYGYRLLRSGAGPCLFANKARDIPFARRVTKTKS